MDNLRKHRGFILVSFVIFLAATLLAAPVLSALLVPHQGERTIAQMAFYVLGLLAWFSYVSLQIQKLF